MTRRHRDHDFYDTKAMCCLPGCRGYHGPPVRVHFGFVSPLCGTGGRTETSLDRYEVGCLRCRRILDQQAAS